MSKRKAYIRNATADEMSFYEGCRSVVHCDDKQWEFTMTIGTDQAAELGVDVLGEELARTIFEMLACSTTITFENVRDYLSSVEDDLESIL